MRTGGKRKNSFSAAIDRPFAAEVLKQARAAAKSYRLIAWQEGESFLASAVELPHVLGVGSSADAAMAEVRTLLIDSLGHDLERGIEPPPPASANRRQEQINIRLTPLERRRLEIAAEAGGYHGVSDYVREKILAVK